MGTIKGLLCFFLLFFISVLSVAQSVDAEDAVELLLEKLENEENNIHADQILEDLYRYAKNPLNINHANEEELNALHVINAFQIKSLKDYIQRNGKLLSVYELQFVVGFNVQLVKRLKPFVTVKSIAENKNSGSGLSLREKFKYGKNRLMMRVQRNIQKPEGYFVDTEGEENAPKYKGNMYRLYSKYAFTYNDDLALGITMEKDPGEEFFTGSNRAGFDFYSFHMKFRPEKGIDAVVLGDYNVGFGQGLVLWNGFAFGKLQSSVDVMKNASGLKKYTSADEHNFFRGIALEKTFDAFNLTMFYSDKNVDANLLQRNDNEDKYFTSLQTTGYHRTTGEIEDKNALNEKVLGSHLLYRASNFEAGITMSHNWYDGMMVENSDGAGQFDFSGSRNTNAGLNYRFLLGKFHLFGETAMRELDGYAFLNGMHCRLSSDISFSLLHRYYDKKYYSSYSSGFSENTSTTNESGIYAGLRIALSPSFKAILHMDTYRFHWIKHTADAPSGGRDFNVDLTYAIDKNNEIAFRFKHKMKQEKNEDLVLSGLTPRNSGRFRLHYSSDLSEHLRWSNRMAVSDYHKDNADEFGWLMYQEFRYASGTFPLTLYFRYAFFDTDGYYSRIYTYEHDVLHAFSIPVFYSKGYRIYLNIRYNMDKMNFYFKLAQTEYFDKNEVGSGLNKIKGNTKTEAKIQVVYKF
ncbi:MAG: helix-hairpin-helix domain-containing protein [Bacteroidales bacterium]